MCLPWMLLWIQASVCQEAKFCARLYSSVIQQDIHILWHSISLFLENQVTAGIQNLILNCSHPDASGKPTKQSMKAIIISALFVPQQTIWKPLQLMAVVGPCPELICLVPF